jgi:hypothetical protein
MRLFRPAVVCAGTLLAVTACNKNDNTGGQDALAQDSSLTRDLALANTDTTSQPQLKDVATSPTVSATGASSE